MKHDAASGIVLLAAALLALMLQNSPAGWLYDNLLHTPARSASARSRSASRCCTGSTTA